MQIAPFLKEEGRAFRLSHAPIAFHFRQSARDFVVEELPLYEFSGEGEHLMLTVRKKNLTTQEMLNAISAATGIKTREMGYAGLKDKHALTIQTVSIPKKMESTLSRLDHPQIRILDTAAHNNKLRIGHLRGNRFFIRLKKTAPVEAAKITQALQAIQTAGMPNYFGYQRFGREGNNHEEGRLIVQGQKQLRNKKLRTFLISAYQSHLYNQWLALRIRLTLALEAMDAKETAAHLGLDSSLATMLKKQASPLALLPGDLLCHYPHGRLFACEDIESESQRFSEKEIVPTGLLSGNRVKIAEDLAGELEAGYVDEEISESGSRRYAWVFPEQIESRYLEEEAWMELRFTLPSGAYATVLLEELAKRELKGEIDEDD